MDENKLMLEFLSNKFGTSDQKQIQKKLSKLDKEQQQALAQEYQQWKAKKKTKAAHGAKLDYVKSLKHICPEGQELVYFKKGGSVNCGCVGKKLEKGDKVEASGAVTKFKKIKKVGFGSWITKLADATGSNGGFKKAEQESKKKSENNKRKPVTNVATQDKNPGSTKQPMQEAQERARHKNDYNNLKKGGAVDKFKSAKCGSKMKKHQNGGLIQKSHILDRVFPQSIVK